MVAKTALYFARQTRVQNIVVSTVRPIGCRAIHLIHLNINNLPWVDTEPKVLHKLSPIKLYIYTTYIAICIYKYI